MKKKLFLILWMMCLTGMNSAQNTVYYYERVMVVANGQKTNASGDGHYLALNNNGLYECDANGSTQRCGFIKFAGNENGRYKYEGDGFLGKDLTYLFNNDYSRLNLYLWNGTIYVYARRQSPSSASAVRTYQRESAGQVYIPQSGNESTRTSTTNQKHRRTCSLCNGTGSQVKYQVVSSEVSGKKKWCSQCGQNVSYGHYHIRCTCCGGKGYIED